MTIVFQDAPSSYFRGDANTDDPEKTDIQDDCHGRRWRNYLLVSRTIPLRSLRERDN